MEANLGFWSGPGSREPLDLRKIQAAWLKITNLTLKVILREAYGVKPY